MQQCPLCNATYADEVSACPRDGARLAAHLDGDPLLGRVIKGRYRVVDKLGEGAMGAVYLAEQLSIRRRVALKVLHRQFARNPELVQRFHQEATLAASLNHPHITTVFDFDQGEDGSLFIVMEYLEGALLSEIIRREHPMDIARVLHLGLQIADGLGAAHAAGVIHRDVKPQNIMVLAPGEAVKLMDFGIARLGDAQDAAHLTRAGALIGTPNYMAPEQIEGRPVSTKTDIYAFGIVLYEMLTGTTPFGAATSMAVLAKQLREAPPPLRRVRPAVPPLVEQVVMQALEKQPGWRQQSVADVARGLRIAGGASAPSDSPRSPAPPPSGPAPGSAPGRRSRRPWALTAAVGGAVVVAGALIAALIAAGRPSPASTTQTLAHQSAPTLPGAAPASPTAAPPPGVDPIAIRTAVEAKLGSAGLLRGHGSDELGVTVEAVGPDGVVSLAGVVRNPRDRDAVVRLARSVTGVTGVASRVNVPWTSP